jgi:hypothetical protein
VPGIIVARGVSSDVASKLERRFRSIWGDIETLRFGNTTILGHAFQPHRCVHDLGSGRVAAVDGERSIYRLFNGTPDAIWSTLQSYPVVGVPYVGNVILSESSPGSLSATADWTATFPLYYWHAAGTGHHQQPPPSARGRDQRILGRNRDPADVASGVYVYGPHRLQPDPPPAGRSVSSYQPIAVSSSGTQAQPGLARPTDLSADKRLRNSLGAALRRAHRTARPGPGPRP